MDTVKKNDWLATILFNPDKTLDDFEALDVTPDNTGLLPIEDYKNNPTVQQFFINNETGKFDEAAFINFYNNAKISYDQYENNTWTRSAISKYGYGEDAWYAPLDAKVRDEAPRFFIDNKPSSASQGVSFITETGTSLESDLSIRELAQREKAVDSETGEVFDWSPNEKGGLFKSLSRPTLVLAQWDEDGIHDENGIAVEHKKGDLKFNESGKPYYETLGNRDIYGKDVLHYVDTLTVDGTRLNKFDFLDSDSKEKGLGATLIRTAAQVAPMFAGPVIGGIYGAITAIGALNRVMPILAKGIDSIITGTDDNPFGRKMSEWEAWSEANFNWQTVSDKGREKFFSTEGMGNLIGAISGQLFQQKLIGTLPAILNKAGSYKKNAELGKDLALGYMAITSAQDAYSDFKQAGATDRVAGMGMIASMVGLYGLMNQDYFRDNLFRYSFMDEQGVRVPALKFAKEFDTKTLEALGKTAEKQQVAGFINKAKNIWQNKFINAINSNEFVARSVAEGTEEVMEEVVTDLIKAFNMGLEGLGATLTENKEENLDFGWSGQDFLQRYAMNALGGFVGGGIFHMQGKYDKWYRTRFHPELKNDIANDDFKRLVYFIGNGQADTIRGYYTKWWRQGRLGSTNLTADDEVLSYLDENKVIKQVAKRGDYTQNDVVYAGLMNMISELEQSVKAEIGLPFLDPKELDKIAVRGFNPDKRQLINAHAMVELGSYSRFANDFWNTITELVRAKSNLEAKIKSLETGDGASTDAEKKASAEHISKNDEIKHLQEQIKELEEKKQAFLNGDKNKYYAGQALFFINENINKHFLDIKDINDFSLFKYKTKYDDLADYQKKEADEDFKDYLDFKGTDKISAAYDLYLGFSQAWGPALNEAAELLKGVNSDSFHKDNLEYENYVALLKEANNLETTIKKLMSEEGADQEEIKNLQLKQAEINSKIAAIQENTPNFILQLQVDDKYSTLREGFLADIDTPTLVNMLNTLRSIYSEANGKYMANDDQLNSFFTLIGKQYKKMPIDERFKEFCNTLSSSLSNDPDIPYELEEFNGKERLFNDFGAEGQFTSFQNEILSDIQDAVDLLSVDNKGFINKINDIRQKIKNNTLLTDELIEYFLDNMLPAVGDIGVYGVIKEFDGYKANIIYDPFIDTLDKLIKRTIGGKEYSIVDLLNIESKRLAESEDVTKYIIQNDKLKELFANNKIEPLASSFVGVIYGASDNTNALINSFVGGEISDLAEIDENVFKLLVTQAGNFFSKIKILKEISDLNSSSALRISQDIEINMRPKFIQKLIDPTFAAEFDSVFKGFVQSDVPDKPSLTAKFESLFKNGVNFNSKSDSYYKQINAGFIELEDYVYNVFSEFLKQRGSNELIKNVRHLVVGDGENDLYKGISTTLSKKIDEAITPYTFGQYLATLAVLPASTFYAHEKTLLETDSLRFVPTFGQEWAYRVSTAFLLDPKFFNSLLDEFINSERMKLDKGLDEDDVKWLKHKAVLHNFLMVPGGAGTGKTVGYCGTLIQSIAGYKGKVEVLALAPEEKQAEKLAESLGITDKNKYFTRKGFQTTLVNTVLGHYIQDKESCIRSLDYMKNRDTFKFNNLYDKETDVKILVIDEVTLFTRDELSLISDWATQNGVLVFALGDPKQTSMKVLVSITKDGTTKTSLENTGIEDCFYWKAPKLTASLRNANEAKRVNEVWMSTHLDDIDEEYTKNPTFDIAQLDAKTPDSVSLVYYESDDKETLYGEKLVKSSEVLQEYIDRFKDKGSVMIITDDNDKFNNYTARYKADNVTVVKTENAQGGESDYVFVDKDFKKANESRNGSTSKYLTFKDLYTTSQRSTTATVIVDNGLSSTLKITDNTSNNLYNQQFRPIDKGQTDSAKKWKLETLGEIHGKSDLFALLENSKDNRKGYEKVEGTKSAEGETSESGETNPIGEGENSRDGQSSTNEGEDSKSTDENIPDPSALPPVVTPTGRSLEEKPRKFLKYEIKAENTDKPIKIVLSGKSLFDYFKVPNFISYDENGNLNGIEKEFSLAEFIFNLDNNKRRIDTPNLILEYKKWINCIASFAKENIPLPEIFAKDLANFIVGNETDRSDLIKFFQRKPEIYFVDHNTGAKVVARYTTSKTHIDIPIGFIYNDKPRFGKYDGKFTMRETTDKRFIGDQKVSIDSKENPLSLSEFRDLNPFVILSDEWGVLSVKNLDAVIDDPDLRDSTKEFLGVRFEKDYYRKFNNNGKTFAFATTSPAIAYQFFNDDSWNPENGYSVASYGKYLLLGVQKTADVGEITTYVRSFANSFTSDKKRQEWLRENDPKNTVKYLTGQNTSNIKESEKRKYQVIPNNMLGYFTRGLFDIAQNNDTLLKHLSNGLFNYLHSGKLPEKKSRGENHCLLLKGDGKTVLVQPIMENGVYRGKYNIVENIGTKNETTKEVIIDIFNTDFSDICKAAFDGHVESVQIGFRTIVLADNEHSAYPVDVVPNKVLFYLLNDLTEEDIRYINDKLPLNPRFKFNCYVNMYGDDKKSFGDSSYYKPYNGSKNNITIRVKEVIPADYRMDMVNITSTTSNRVFDVNGNKAYKTWQELVNMMEIEDDPKLQEVLAKNKDKVMVLNTWLLANSSDFNRIRQIVKDEATGLYYESSYKLKDPSKWIIQNFNWRVLGNFDLNSNLTNVEFDGNKEQLISDINNLKYGLFFVSLPNELQYFIVKTNDGWGYKQTAFGKEFSSLRGLANELNSNAISAYINTLPFDYVSDYDNIVKSAYNEIRNRKDTGNLNTALNEYLTKRLEQNEC